MSLATPASVQKLQTALHDKAKGSPNFRFYALYDKVYRKDVLAFAYDDVQSVKGVAGLGLISMRERLRLVGGNFSIESEALMGYESVFVSHQSQ